MAATITFKTSMTYTPDTGRAGQIINDNTETDMVPTKGYTLGDVFTLAVAATNYEVVLPLALAAVLIEETSGADKGVLVRVGSSSAAPLRVKRLLVEAPSLDVSAVGAATSIFFTNEGTAQISVRLGKVTAD